MMKLRISLLMGISFLAALGCAGRGNVSGQVSCEGKSLVFGTVQFEASDGSLHQANLETDGHYSIAGLPPGEALVAVSSRNPKSSDFIPIEKAGMPKMPRLPDVKGWFPIPQKYEKPVTSGLSYPIKTGENRIDIDLKKP